MAPTHYPTRLDYLLDAFLTTSLPLGHTLPSPPDLTTPYHTCPICVEPIHPSQPIFSRCTRALHPLHRLCALRWLSTYHPDATHYASSCPMCRAPFYTSPAEPAPLPLLTELRERSDDAWRWVRRVRDEAREMVAGRGEEQQRAAVLEARRSGWGNEYAVEWWALMAPGAEVWMDVVEGAVWLAEGPAEARRRVEFAEDFKRAIEQGIRRGANMGVPF